MAATVHPITADAWATAWFRLHWGHHRNKAVQYSSLANNNVNSKAICIPVFAASRIGWCSFHIVIGF